MATDIELKKIEWELHRVAAARAELEFKVLQKTKELEEIKDSIAIQRAKEAELTAKLNEGKE